MRRREKKEQRKNSGEFPAIRFATVYAKSKTSAQQIEQSIRSRMDKSDRSKRKTEQPDKGQPEQTKSNAGRAKRDGLSKACQILQAQQVGTERHIEKRNRV